MQGIINHTYFHFLSTQNMSRTLGYGGFSCFTGNKGPPARANAFAARVLSFTFTFQAQQNWQHVLESGNPAEIYYQTEIMEHLSGWVQLSELSFECVFDCHSPEEQILYSTFHFKR